MCMYGFTVEVFYSKELGHTILEVNCVAELVHIFHKFQGYDLNNHAITTEQDSTCILCYVTFSYVRTYTQKQHKSNIFFLSKTFFIYNTYIFKAINFFLVYSCTYTCTS